MNGSSITREIDRTAADRAELHRLDRRAVLAALAYALAVIGAGLAIAAGGAA